MGNYLKGNTWSEVYKKVLCVGGDSADHAGLTASEKNVWTDDGSAGKTLSAFQLSSDTLLMITTNKLAFTDTATYVNNPGTGHLKLVGREQLTIESGSTGFTVDSAGDIVLDADGADVSLKDNTVQFIKFTNNAGDCEVYNGVADKDIIFKDLGGNTIMTLDGSAESLLMATNKKIEFSTTDEHIYGDGTDRMVVNKMSRYSPEEIAIKELEDSLTDTAYMNAIMQDALELIASNTEENSKRIAQETLEAIAQKG